MGILRTYGFGSRKILSQGHQTTGKVTSVKTCWWIKINTKPVRTHSMDGAVFPHIIHFTYHVNGAAYEGSRYVSYALRCPSVHEEIAVFFDPADPAKYAVKL